MEFKDNQLLRQFEAQLSNGTSYLEYVIQEKKLFLTKLSHQEGDNTDEVNAFIKEVLVYAVEKRLRVVPTHPMVAAFFRKNPSFKELLPPGIKL